MTTRGPRAFHVIVTMAVIVLPGAAVGGGGVVAALSTSTFTDRLDGVVLAVLGLAGAALQVAAWFRPAAARAASWCCLVAAMVPLVFLSATVLADVSSAEVLSWDYYRWFGGGCLAVSVACGAAWWLNRRQGRRTDDVYLDPDPETEA